MEKLLRRKKKAEIANNKTLLTSACIDLANLYLDKGHYNSAIREYKIVAAIYKEQDKMLDYACANRMIGEAYTNLQQYEDALKHVQVYLTVTQKEANEMEEQRALATIGHIYLTKSLCLEEEPNSQSLKLAAKNFLASLSVCEKLTGISKHEHMDMMARLFSNLGIVKETQGNFQKGIELVTRSVNICKKYDLFEQLERGYTILSSVYSKSGDYSNAIANINLAMEVAGRLPDKVSLTCASLLAKAEILVKMSDLQGAKRVLYKSYKFKVPNEQDRTNIERNLRIVTAMTNAEESLLIASDSDYIGKKKLYERLGDGACHFKNFPKAIYYYKIMLEFAMKSGESGRDLSPCYNSLAQTYQDNKDFDEAIEYFRKDVEVCNGNTKETVNTLLQLTEALDLGGKSFAEIMSTFNTAKAECCHIPPLLAKVLNRMITFLRKRHKYSEAIDCEKELEKLGIESSQSDGEESQTLSVQLGDDVDLDEITDLSSSDDEKEQSTRSMRKRNTALTIKKNAKGETQLHVAAIHGNAPLVKRLLEQGHAVNIRDNAGWLPIHEACICGHLEIVKMLLDKGAAINDRGGTLCNGITPLHDAASNGHLEVIELLLERGASPLSKSDNGQTPLSILKNWRAGVSLDPDQITLYETLVERMANILEKAGQKDETIPTGAKSNEALVLVDDSCSQSVTSFSPAKSTSVNGRRSSKLSLNRSRTDLRRNINAGDSDDDDLVVTNATNEYQDVIASLRPHNTSQSSLQSQFRKRKSSDVLKPAHLLPDEVDVDHWLIDDMPSQMAKKRCGSNLSLLRGQSVRNQQNAKSPAKVSNLTNIKSQQKAKSPLNRTQLQQTQNEKENESVIDIMDFEEDSFEGPNISQLLKGKKQSTLLKAGFTKLRSSSPLNFSLLGSAKRSNSPSKSNRNSLQNSSSDSIDINNSTQNLIGKKSVFIDVRIEGKLFRISIATDELELLTISWLAEEATKRYYKKESIKPKIELETKSGAILSDEDFLYTLFPVGTSQCEELQAKVVTWNIPPLNERYKDVCNYLNIATNEKLMETLEVATENLKLSDKNLRTDIIPVFKALNRQSNLYELDLSGNLFGDKAFESFCETLPSLMNLSVFNCSSNNITYQGLQLFLLALEKQSVPLHLKDLNFSFNPLNNESLKIICKISNILKLHSLFLSCVGFSQGVFEVSQNKDLKLSLDGIRNFDISFNELNSEELVIFLESLTCDKVECLDFGENLVENDIFALKLASFFNKNEGKLSLKKLNLSKCFITDAVISETSRFIQRAENFEELDLSYNEFTASSFKQLLEETSLNRLAVLGCSGLKEEENVYMTDWSFKAPRKCRNLHTTLDYARDFIHCDTLMNLFRNQYPEIRIDGLNDGLFRLHMES